MRYPQPPNEDAFEEFSLALLRRHWNAASLERYGHRGETQYGVDLLDLGGKAPFRAAQCKHHAPEKTLPPSELKEEVEKARKFCPPLGYYLVLTTAKKSADTQDELLRLNKEQHELGLFQVELMTWEAIERLVDQYPDIQGCLAPAVGVMFQAATDAALQRIVAGVVQALPVQASPTAPDERDRDIDEAKAYLERSEFQSARLLLNRLRERDWDSLTARQRFRIAANTASALMGEGRFADAGRYLGLAPVWWTPALR
jgi:hypothetical protein